MHRLLDLSLMVAENAVYREDYYEVPKRLLGMFMLELERTLEERTMDRYVAVRAYKDEEFGEHLIVDLEHPKGHKKYLPPEDPGIFATVVQSGLTPEHAQLLTRALNQGVEP